MRLRLFVNDKWCLGVRHNVTMSRPAKGWSVSSKMVGALPIINHFLQALELDYIFNKFVPGDSRNKVAPATALGVLLRNLLVAREPLYALSEWTERCEKAFLGLPPDEPTTLNDDSFGRSLDKLFLADRAGLMTAVVVRAVQSYGLSMEEMHNDSTTVTFEGEYRGASGHAKSGRPTARIAHGHNKDHRPDLKQLLYILTTTADGAVPIWSAVTHGNRTDDKTHIETWTALRGLVGKPDFLYVADSKLCTYENMFHIDGKGGRFITVLPNTRKETDWFRDWKEKNDPKWTELIRYANSRNKEGPDEVYCGYEPPLLSSEGFRILWVHSTPKAERDILTRQRRIARACDELGKLSAKLSSPKSRYRDAQSAREAANEILASTHTTGLINVAVEVREEESFKQTRPGRPTTDTAYVRTTKSRLVLHWSQDTTASKLAAKMDGIFPLITNDSNLSMAAILASYKHQPALERRHEQLKTVLDVMPMSLKSSTRIEALLFLYFLAVLVHALVERQLRKRMAADRIAELPLYPEHRLSKRPTADQVFRLFDDVRRNHLLDESGNRYKTFADEMTERQKTVLRLLDMSSSNYFTTTQRPTW